MQNTTGVSDSLGFGSWGQQSWKIPNASRFVTTVSLHFSISKSVLFAGCRPCLFSSNVTIAVPSISILKCKLIAFLGDLLSRPVVSYCGFHFRACLANHDLVFLTTPFSTSTVASAPQCPPTCRKIQFDCEFHSTSVTYARSK